MAAITGIDELLDEAAGSTGAAAVVSTGSDAPQRHVATFRGTRRPHAGQTRLNAVWSWPAPKEVEGSGMGHNKGLNHR